MTYSIVAFDPETGDLGIAVQSKFPNVGGLVPHARAGHAAVATQAFGNPALANRILALVSLGTGAREALNIALRSDPDQASRQFGVVDAAGHPAAFTGAVVRTWPGFAGDAQGAHCTAQGNGLAGPGVVEAMVRTFETASSDTLAHRLVDALQAGETAGGELRGQQSAALVVVREGGGYGGADDRLVTISIYDHAEPIDELARCLAIHGLSYFPSQPDNLVPIDPALARELKGILTALNFLRDEGDPEHWDAAAIGAMERLMGWANYDNRIRDDALIDREVLDDLRRSFTAGTIVPAPRG
ncbi:MAG: DUF1028 domain-containing protein [Alphaproteobacteria bacterium]